MKPYHAGTPDSKNALRVRHCACCASKYGGKRGGVEGHRAGRKKARQEGKKLAQDY